MAVDVHAPRTFVSLAEAAEVLGLAVSTVRQRVYDGTVPATKVGRKLVIRVSDLHRLKAVAPRPRRTD